MLSSASTIGTQSIICPYILPGSAPSSQPRIAPKGSCAPHGNPTACSADLQASVTCEAVSLTSIRRKNATLLATSSAAEDESPIAIGNAWYSALPSTSIFKPGCAISFCFVRKRRVYAIYLYHSSPYNASLGMLSVCSFRGEYVASLKSSSIFWIDTVASEAPIAITTSVSKSVGAFATLP